MVFDALQVWGGRSEQRPIFKESDGPKHIIQCQICYLKI